MASLALNPVDLDDALLTQMDDSDVVQQIETMRQQEQTTYSCTDYLIENEEFLVGHVGAVDEDCRVKMSEWCYQVVDFCQFRRETVSIGMSYLDRYLCTDVGRGALANRKQYQLVAMTALYVAIKINEPMEMETGLLADLSRGCYQEMDFVYMELKLLQAIEWQLNGPTALCFVQYYLALTPDSVEQDVAEGIMDYARYQLELAVSESALISIPKSEIGFAAILNSMEGMDSDVLPTAAQEQLISRIEEASGLMVEDVADIQCTLSGLLVSLLEDEKSEVSSVSSSRVSQSDDTSTKESFEKSPVCVTKRDNRIPDS